MDLEGKLVKLAALEAAFDHFTNKHWIPLQAVVLSLHDSLCWVCRGDGEPIPDQVRSSSAPPSLSITIPVPLPRIGRRPATPGPPPLSPVIDDDSSIIPMTCLHLLGPLIQVLLSPPPLCSRIALNFMIEQPPLFPIDSLRVSYLDTVPYQSRLSDVILRSCSV